jgi:hypothetical protein
MAYQLVLLSLPTPRDGGQFMANSGLWRLARNKMDADT